MLSPCHLCSLLPLPLPPQNGQLISPKDAAAAPKVHIRGGSEGGLFTLLATDPDPPGEHRLPVCGGVWQVRCGRRAMHSMPGCDAFTAQEQERHRWFANSPMTSLLLPCLASDPANPVYREWLHMIACNVPAGGDASQGTQVRRRGRSTSSGCMLPLCRFFRASPNAPFLALYLQVTAWRGPSPPIGTHRYGG